MKQMFFFFLLLALAPFKTSAQNPSSDEDHTLLNEIQIDVSRKQKLQLIKLKGGPAYNGVASMKKIVSLVENIPDGKISFVEFYFNTGMINLIKENLDIQYEDTEFGLLIYEEVNGRVGNVISEGDITFTVGKKHKGGYRVDLSSLNLPYKKIFIGFERLSEATDKNTSYVRLSENKKAVSYSVYQNIDDSWREFGPGMHLKLTLGIEK